MGSMLKKSILGIATILLSISYNAQASQFFYTDFDNGVPSEFSGITTSEPVNGYSAYGFSGQFLRNWSGTIWIDNIQPESTILTLTNLPAHNSIDVNFLLAIINSWDGEGEIGPDVFNVKIDGNTIFSESFSNVGKPQSYLPPAGVQLTTDPLTDLTGEGAWPDSAYDMGIDPVFNGIPHSSDTLTIEWVASGAGWQGYPASHLYPDEYWAIDNVEVILVPEPATLSLLALGALALMRKRRNR